MTTKARVRQRRAASAKQQRTRTIGIAVIGVVIVGFIGWQFAQATRPAAPTVVLSDKVGANLGEVAPDFSVPTLGGGEYTLAAFDGKPRVLFAMAYWCTTCLPEARALAQLELDFGDRISILALDVDPSSTPTALAQFKAAVGDPDYVWAFDAGQQVTNLYQIAALDTTLILDQNGQVAYRDAYPTNYTTLKTTIDGLLQ